MLSVDLHVKSERFRVIGLFDAAQTFLTYVPHLLAYLIRLTHSTGNRATKIIRLLDCLQALVH